MTTRLLKTLAFVLFALALGFIGLSLLFAGLGPGETIQSRTVPYLVSGFVIGYFSPLIWWLSGLVGGGGATPDGYHPSPAGEREIGLRLRTKVHFPGLTDSV